LRQIIDSGAISGEHHVHGRFAYVLNAARRRHLRISDLGGRFTQSTIRAGAGLGNANPPFFLSSQARSVSPDGSQLIVTTKAHGHRRVQR